MNEQKTNTGLRALGIAMCSGGGAILGSTLVRQILADQGQTYYAFMVGGGVIAVIGVIILRSIRSRAQN